MSRTYRRKNAWNKKDFIDYDRDWLEHMSGENPFPYMKFHRRKYNGLSVEKIKKRLENKFHSDSMNYRRDNRGVKAWSKWWLRHHLNQDLQKAIREGDEDNLYSDEKQYKKRMNGWWLWWD